MAADETKQKSFDQLNLLLLKAESYSQFILNNQQQSKGLKTNNDENEVNGKKRKIDVSKTPVKAKTSKNTKLSNDLKLTRSSEKSPSEISTPHKSQPSNLVGGTLKDYQLEGLQWLLSLWENGLNGILADEMGLGKTIQIIALLAYLRSTKTSGPYLIVGPLATLPNWVKEFRKWLPSCPVVLYHGDKATRETLRRTQLPIANQKLLDFPIIITSFEMCIADRKYLENYSWQYLIVDEGHRIKNRNCKLLRELKSLPSVSRLLLSGTPIQNTLEELWTLLNFCSPMIFSDLEVFRSWFDFKNIGQDTQIDEIVDNENRDRIVSKLHEILRPFLLRRLKKDVMIDIPQKREIVVYCGMTPLQIACYDAIEEGRLREYLEGMRMEKSHTISQLNKLMNQRKASNHPFLFGNFLDSKSNQSLFDVHPESIVLASGKIQTLDRMLPRLKAEHHKVLIFSQMTRMLDLLEDYLDHRGYRFVRFDGSSSMLDRQEHIDSFNNTSCDELFIFLISTRAGGLGINLTAADTVILFDSDWNPHQDLQAQDRCHRIGQSKAVVIYRLLSIGTMEIEMMKKQISKKKLERLTVFGGDFRSAGKRSKGRQMSTDELRQLLEDDVRNISRMTSRNDDGIEGEGRGREGHSNAVTVSERELDWIMNRDLLFNGINTEQYNQEYHQLNGPDTVEVEAVPPDGATAINLESMMKLAEEEEYFDTNEIHQNIVQPETLESDKKKKKSRLTGRGSSLSSMTTIESMPSPSSFSTAELDAFIVPLEGEMYDIVIASGGFQ